MAATVTIEIAKSTEQTSKPVDTTGENDGTSGNTTPNSEETPEETPAETPAEAPEEAPEEAPAKTSTDTTTDTIKVILQDADNGYFNAGDSKFTLKRIDYDKGIYTPGKIVLSFSVGSDYDGSKVRTELNDKFLGQKVSLNISNDDTTTNGNDIATDYYIHSYQIKVSKYSGITMRTLIMTCYSPDFKQTLKPTCNAWTGKCFGKDILGSVFTGTKDEVNKADNYSFLANRVTNDSTRAEANQPYLVQYNESFYDFACRTANRCGEFLYYEDGGMHLGLPNKGNFANAPTDDTAALDVMIEDSCTCFESATIENIHSVNGLSDNTVASKTSLYDYAVADDAFLKDAIPNKNMKNLDFMGAWMVFTTFADCLQGQSWEDVISTFINDAVSLPVADGIAYGIAQYEYHKNYIDGDKSKEWSKSKYVKSLGVDDIYQIGQDEKDYMMNFVNEFYHQIEQLEKKVTDQKLTLNFEDKIHEQKLGNEVYLKEFGHVYHIVTRLYGSLNCESGSCVVSHKAEVIPAIDVSGFTKKFAYKANGSVTKLSNFVPIPPLDSRPRIRHADPQEATVYDSADPLFCGRVRVKFPWQATPAQVLDDNGEKKDDPTANASPWIRFSTPFSGAEGTGGFFMMPAKNSHVMVNFMNGNVEMPYVQSALFTKTDQPDRGYVDLHKKYMLPNYSLKTISSANGHSISFVDNKGVLNFLAGMIPLVPTILKTIAQACEWKWEDKYLGTGGNMVLRDANGVYEINMSTEGRSITITSAIGKVEIDAFTGINISAPNGDINITGKNINLKAGNNITLQSGTNINSDGYDPVDNLAASAAGLATSIVMSQAKSALKQAHGLDLSKLCDLKFIRAATEVILRPVEGSLKLMSKRNVIMTSGKGKVAIPASNLAHAYSAKTGAKDANYNKLFKPDYSKTFAIIDTLEALRTTFTRDYYAIIHARCELLTAFSTLKMVAYHSYFAEDNALSGNMKIQKFKLLLEPAELDYGRLKDFITEIGIEGNKYIPFDAAGILAERNIANQNENYNRYMLQATVCVQYARYILDATLVYVKALSKSETPDIQQDFTYNVAQVTNDLQGIIAQKSQDFGADIIPAGITIPDINDTEPDVFIKNVFKAVLSQTLPLYNAEFTDNDDWNAYVDSIKMKKYAWDSIPGISVAKAAIGSLISTTGFNIDLDDFSNDAGKLVNWNGQAGPRALWEIGHGGGIYVSNNPAVTCTMNSNGKSWIAVANPFIERIKAYLKDPKVYADRGSKDQLEAYFTNEKDKIKEQSIKLPEEDSLI